MSSSPPPLPANPSPESALSIQTAKFLSLGLKQSKSPFQKGEEGFVNAYERNLNDASEGNPVLVLLHGYPQSAYM